MNQILLKKNKLNQRNHMLYNWLEDNRLLEPQFKEGQVYNKINWLINFNKMYNKKRNQFNTREKEVY